MLQSGSVLFDPNASSVNRFLSWPGRVRLAAVLALSLVSVALPNLSWARSPQFDSAALLTPEKKEEVVQKAVEAGVTKALEILHRELDLTMAFCGHTAIDTVDARILVR